MMRNRSFAPAHNNFNASFKETARVDIDPGFFHLKNNHLLI